MCELFPTLRAWQEYAESDLAPVSVASYRYWILRFHADTLVDPHEAQTEHLHAFLGSFGDKGTAKSMAKRAVRHYFQWLHLSGRRGDDPSSFLPRVRRRKLRMPHYLTEDELTRVVYAAATYRPAWAAMLLFMLGTGCRVSEMLNLLTDDIDLDKNAVIFRSTKNGMDRFVPLGPSSRFGAEMLMNGTKYLLGDEPPHPNTIRRRLKILARMTSLDPARMHPHALRHSCGTLLSEKGASEVAIMNHLGHVDPSMVRTYIHVTSKRAKETAALF
jgi:integrase/recombinase XerD